LNTGSSTSFTRAPIESRKRTTSRLRTFLTTSTSAPSAVSSAIPHSQRPCYIGVPLFNEPPRSMPISHPALRGVITTEWARQYTCSLHRRTAANRGV
jgi:hypothetical protein